MRELHEGICVWVVEDSDVPGGGGDGVAHDFAGVLSSL